MPKLWGYITALFGLVIGAVTFWYKAKQSGVEQEQLKQAKDDIEEHKEKDDFNHVAKNIETKNSRISNKQLFAGLRKYAKKE